ncbi:MAG: translocation/assembly module TamB domain-containing protein [Thermodesulfobacteriota bacterium]
MKRIRFILLAILLLLFLVGLGGSFLLRADFFWSWGGRYLVSLAQERLPGKLTVRQIDGNPLTGLTFTDIVVSDSQGEVLRVPRLEMRFSLWSFVKLQPVIARLAVYEPHLTLRAGKESLGRLGPLPKPGGAPEAAIPFRSLTFSQILVQDGEIALFQAGETQRWQKLSLQLSLTVLYPLQPQQAVLVRRASLAVTSPWGPLGLNSRFSYSHQRLNLLALTVEAWDRDLLALTGEVRLDEKEPVLQLAGEFGPLTAQEMRRVWGGWPAPWELAGRFQVQGTPARLQLTGIGRLHPVAYTLKGLLTRHPEKWDYDLNLNLDGLRGEMLEPVNKFWAQKVRGLGPLTARLNLQGSGFAWPPPRFAWTLEGSPVKPGAAPLEQLKISLAGNDREQQIQGLIQGNFGRLTLLARGPLFAHLRGELKVQAEGCQPTLLGLAAPPGSLLNGNFTGRFHWPELPSLPSLSLSGEVAASGRLGRESLKELRGRLVWEKARLGIPQARLQVGELRADLQGSLDKDRVDLYYRAGLSPGGSWPLLPAGRGRLTGEGSLTGPLSRPLFTLKAQGRSLSWGAWRLARANINISGMGWPPHCGSLSLQGKGLITPAGDFSQAYFYCQGSGDHWRVNLKAASPQGPRVELLGAADLARRPYQISLERCGFQLEGFSGHNTGPVQVRILPGLELAPATFQINEGRLTLAARVQGDKVSGHLEAGDLPGEVFRLKGIPLAGKINGQVTLQGKASRPTFQGQFALKSGRWGDFPFNSLSTTLNYQDTRLELAGSLEEKASGPRLVWQGHLPLDLSLNPVKMALRDEEVNLQVQGENANLSLLAALTPEVQAAAGPLDIRAEWRGRASQPQVSGLIRWGPGQITPRQAGLSYRLEPGEIRLAGDSLTIPPITLVSGGTATLTGNITLAGFLPKQLDARVQLQNFKALGRIGSEAVGDGTITLTGPWSAPLLQGHLLVTQATFNTSFFQTSIHKDIVLVGQPSKPETPAHPKTRAPAFERNLRMALVLESTGGVWVKNKRLKIELAGRLKASKTPGQPAQVGGDLKALQGTVEIQGRPFKVVEGMIHLPGRPGATTTLEGRATYEMGEVTLVVDASGPASAPVVRMGSIPPLPPPDVLAYLLFGRPAQALTREEYSTVGQQAATILGGVAAKKIQEFLGKDFPLVGDINTVTGQQAIGVAKPLTKDITVSLERKTDPVYRDDANQLRLEYRINRYLGVESQLGRRNSGADVLFNLDW